MTIKFYFILFLIFNSFLALSQDMQEGFTYLETGKYTQAELFFETILEEHPDNKTARLCYSRAIGLNGKSEEAQILFTNLLTDYPSDFEVKLNYGEALLWNNNFLKAEIYFKGLVEEDPKSFPALLSYANTLSNLKDYKGALLNVNKALAISPGNPNALNSKKHMYLGYAYKKQQAQQYSEAEAFLKENLILFPNDTETLLNLSNLYLILNQLDKAKATYNILGDDPKNKLTALNGLALVSHLSGKENDALNLSYKAYNSLELDTKPKLIQSTTERQIQCLIWNKKYKLAKTMIADLIETNPNENWLLALRATLNTYKGDFKISLRDYNLILVNDSTSFDGNLGKANALKASGKYNDAYNAANKTLTIFKNQKDAVNFVNILDKQFAPFIETRFTYSFDNGNNESETSTIKVIVPLSTKLKVNGIYSFRDTKNRITYNEAQANNMIVGFSYLLFPKIAVKTNFGITDINAKINTPPDTTYIKYTQFLTDIVVNIKAFKKQILDLGFKREWQNFNADLLSREIVQNTLYANYNINTNFGLGLYTQYNYTFQNDDNQKHLLFTSLYYNLFDKPLIKTGLNYQYLTFKDQVPTIYFSPGRFNVGEVFVELVKSGNGKWFYNLNAALGFQFIEDQEKQNTYRFQGKLGCNVSSRFTANIYGLHSNIASATFAGFTFTEVGLRLKWDLFKKPIFKKTKKAAVEALNL